MRNYGTTNDAPYASAPPVGAAGDTYWNTTSRMLYESDGTQWIPIGVPPTFPRPGYVLIGGAGPPAWQMPAYRVYQPQIHNFQFGELLRCQGGTTPFVRAQADTEANAEVIGMVVWPGTDEFMYQTSGYVSGLSGLSPGSAYYLSPTTPGGMTITEPNTPGQISKPVFLAITATSGILLSMRGVIVPQPVAQPAVGLLTAAKGIIASGAQISAPAAGAVLPLATVINGAAAWLSGNTVTLPAGGAGLYLIELAVNFVSPSVLAVGFSVRNTAGNDYSPQMMTGGLIGAGNPQNNLHGTWLRQCADFDSFRVYNSANPITSGNASVTRFSLIRIADALGTS